MTLRLREIRPLGGSRYAVTFDAEDGTTRQVECRVFEHRGVTSVRPEPDVFMTGEANAREVTAAVLGYHRGRQRSEEPEWS